MIRHIRIQNFALIENIDVEFHDGLNIITGETGAGKSIVIEAMSLALGSRADTAFVRSGQEKAVVQMVADRAGEEVIITREVSVSGRNICKINGEIVTLAQLAALCRTLADIHGQYDHQSLLDPENHILLLDSYSSDVIGPAKDKVSQIYHQYAETRNRLQELERQLAETRRQQDFMAFELQELTDAHLQSGEDEILTEKVERLRHSEQIAEDLAAAYEMSEGSEYGALSAMRQALDRLNDAGNWDPDAQELGKRLESLYYEFEDVCQEIRRQRDGIAYSPEEMDASIGRLDLLNRLTGKHGKSIDELIAYREELVGKLEDVAESGTLRQELTDELARQEEELSAACGELSLARQSAAKDLESRITAQLEQLNFQDSVFTVDFKTSDQFSPEGTDIVEFLITTNRGEPLKPLARIASGGEMSRIMLAFKKIVGDYDGIPTMIFDEIDSGISGLAASTVGRKLKEIAGSHQVICITHLPQIAVCGDRHYRIQKASDETSTITTVTELSPHERVEEIARLLGGENVTEITRRSAEELLAAAK